MADDVDATAQVVVDAAPQEQEPVKENGLPTESDVVEESPKEEPEAEENLKEETGASEEDAPKEEEPETQETAPEEEPASEEPVKEKEEEKEEEEPEPEVEEPVLEHLNIVFIGHVDAGKSTICGQVLFSTGQVDERTIEKYEKEAREKNRQSWFLAYIMDTNEEERAKGKTVECGRAVFSTEKKRYTILDAPGHKNYVPNMIMGAAQADVGVLVVSARKGEFETGFEKGGQTREHAMLAKTLGVRQLVVLVNKMDDTDWAEGRYTEIKTKISPFLRTAGFNLKNAVRFLPASGMTGAGIAKPVDKKDAPWNKDLSLLDTLDDLTPLGRKHDAPVRFPILDKFRDSGITTVIGKLESGTIRKGDHLVIMPTEKKIEVVSLKMWEKETAKATSGENLSIGVKGAGLEDLLPGFVLCTPGKLCKAVRVFDAQLVMMNLKSVFTTGFESVVHIHTAVEEVSVRRLLSQVDRKTKKETRNPRFLQNGSVGTVRLQAPQNVCVELYEEYQQLGRFTLRDEGKTIAIGKITDLPTLKKKPAQA